MMGESGPDLLLRSLAKTCPFTTVESKGKMPAVPAEGKDDESH